MRVTGHPLGDAAGEIGALAGLATVMLVMLLGQSRVFYSMSRDGLLWPWASRVHPRFRTPYLSSIVVGFFVAVLATLIPLSVLDEMVSVGTLLAFVLVSAGVWVMRRSHPHVNRPFKTPMVPLVPILVHSFLECADYFSVRLDASPAGGVAGHRTGHLFHLRPQAQQGAACGARRGDQRSAGRFDGGLSVFPPRLASRRGTRTLRQALGHPSHSLLRLRQITSLHPWRSTQAAGRELKL